MPYFIVLFMATTLLLAKDERSCYSVQLSSFVIKEQADYRFEQEAYPDQCRLMYFGKIGTIRCGCYAKYSEAKMSADVLQPKYADAKVVTTYKYRFSEQNKADSLEPPVYEADEQELKLLLQVFIYSTDLENAYKTVTKALRYYPKSLYWHQKAAEVSMWTSRREEALEHMLFVYRHTGSKKLEDEIYEYSLSAYQYETAAAIIEKKLRADPSQKNVQQMVYIFDMLGKPIESAELLDEIYEADTSRSALLIQELQIYLNMGELQRAGRVVEKIQKAQLHDLKSAFLLSHYYFLKRDMNASYAALKNVDVKSVDANATEYYKQLSDLSWYMQEYKDAASASVKVDEAGEARLVDFERIMAVYQKEEPKRAMQAALDAYKKFTQNYLFYTYAYMALDAKNYNELERVCQQIEQEENTLVTQDLYWLIKGQMYGNKAQNEKAKESFTLALNKSHASAQTAETVIWFLIDIKADQMLAELLFRLDDRGVDPQLWLPMAVAYFNLQNADRSLYYVNLLRKNGPKNTQVELLYAYIKQGQNEEGAFYKQMHQIGRDMQGKLANRSSLRNDASFMQEYLSVNMLFMNPDIFEKELLRAKKVLSEEAYAELSTGWALRENVDEQVHQMAQRFKHPQPWIKLNLALAYNDRMGQQEILYRYYRTLPSKERVQAAENTQQISLAQELAFEGMRHNEKDALLYEQMRQLHNTYADVFRMEAGYLERSGLAQFSSDMHNSYYLAKGYSLENELFVSSNTIKDNAVFKSLPASSDAVGLGIKKRFDRGYWQIDAGLRDSAELYGYLSFKVDSRVSERLSMQLQIDKGARAEESVYLLAGGQKDRVALQGVYSILGSSQIALYLEGADYLSQDGAALGSGINGRIDYTYLQRSAYPDIRVSPFYSFGVYNEKSGSKGVIDNLLVYADTKVLSDDFWYAGFDLSYGMQNRDSYVRVWRPFFSFSPYFNGREAQLSYAFSTGFGGALFGQDNLSFNIDYSESVGGTNDTLWRSYFSYKILY